MAKAVQFRGLDNVLEAYDNAKIEAWSIWNDKQFLTKGIDRESLVAFLECLNDGESKGVYTLRVYEDVDNIKAIKAKTDYDGSFNFILHQYTEADKSSYYGRLTEKITALEEKISGVEPQEEKETLGSIAMNLLKEPAQLAQMIDIGRAILGMRPLYNNMQQSYQSLPANTIGNVNAIDTGERIGKALLTLEKNDPKLVQHLEKLAAMSEKNLQGFQSLLSMLDMM